MTWPHSDHFLNIYPKSCDCCHCLNNFSYRKRKKYSLQIWENNGYFVIVTVSTIIPATHSGAKQFGKTPCFRRGSCFASYLVQDIHVQLARLRTLQSVQKQDHRSGNIRKYKEQLSLLQVHFYLQHFSNRIKLKCSCTFSGICWSTSSSSCSVTNMVEEARFISSSIIIMWIGAKGKVIPNLSISQLWFQ